MEGLQFHRDIIECGTDEAGRGCLAGPVTAAAVILKPDFKNQTLNDSKQLTEKSREKLRLLIEEQALSWSVEHVMHDEIDDINILNASILAMQRAVGKLTTVPEHIAVDGNRFKPFKNIPHTCIVKGDAKFMNIAAASVLAKTHRDELMKNLDRRFPDYKWRKNKGYPTKEHRTAISAVGASPYHRKSFQLLPKQFKLEL